MLFRCVDAVPRLRVRYGRRRCAQRRNMESLYGDDRLPGRFLDLRETSDSDGARTITGFHMAPSLQGLNQAVRTGSSRAFLLPGLNAPLRERLIRILLSVPLASFRKRLVQIYHTKPGPHCNTE